LKICFLHPGRMSFNVETPFQQPLGGSESALCYLAITLAQEGCEVFLLSNTPLEGTFRGVHCLNHQRAIANGFLRQQPLDLAIVLNSVQVIYDYRAQLANNVPLWLWITLDVDQPPMYPLLQKHIRNEWQLFIFLSEYQRTRFINHYHIDEKRSLIIRYAVGPAFENLFSSQEDLWATKQKYPYPMLAYTSTPFRGLDSLLDVLEPLKKIFPKIQLKVFSSMKVYQKNEDSEEQWLKELYQRCQQTSGVEYIGSLPQPQLAAALKPISILAYPNTFAETACIAVMEALASGCLVVTSEYGALPETTHRFAQLVPVAFRSIKEYENEYLNALTSVILEFMNNPEFIAAHLWDQVCFMNEFMTWKVRAKDWLKAFHNEVH